MGVAKLKLAHEVNSPMAINPNQAGPQHDKQPEPDEKLTAPRAGLLQVAKIIFSGLIMIGRKETWEKGSARVTPVQIVAGSIIGAIALVVALLTLVRVVIGLATD